MDSRLRVNDDDVRDEGSILSKTFVYLLRRAFPFVIANKTESAACAVEATEPGLTCFLLASCIDMRTLFQRFD
jgi:hypothetical protein